MARGRVESGELYARALDDERLLSADRLLKIRFAMGGSLLAIFSGLTFLADPHRFPEGRAVLPVVAGWTVLALVFVVVVRARPSLKAASWYAIPFLDVPTGFLIQQQAVQTSATPDLAAAMTLAGYMLGLIASQLSMQAGTIAATAIMEIVLTAVICARADQWQLWPFVVFVLGFGMVLGVYVPLRVHALLRRVAEEAASRMDALEGRNREIRTLNEELRRQVADRSRQLAEALSRLSAPPWQQAELAPGDMIEGRYRVRRLLGAGGMGRVYEVERREDGRRFALKVLSRVADRDGLVRFAREAQIAAELNHPNVVAAVDVGVSESGILYIIMELVEGSTLADLRSRYRDLQWAVPILGQIAQALAAMHERGIVHRNLKPSNVLLDGDTVKVADFGLASLASPTLHDDTPTPSWSTTVPGQTPLTRTGVFMGTPQYMAPEMEHGARDAGPATDMWSLGVIAHELLNGKLPFGEPPVFMRLQGRSMGFVATLPEDLLEPTLRLLLDRCLAEDPAVRPAALEVAVAAGRASVASAAG